MTAFSARLHVLVASDCGKALVIRRGPTKFVCTVGWDLKTDQFALGQWLRGRIYERRSDLSPDGKHFLYFAMNGRWDSEVKGSYYPRLRRDGWSLLDHDAGTGTTTFDKALGHGWVLRKVAHATSLHRGPGRGCYYDEHLLVEATGARVVPLPAREWADYDGRRILWAIGGALWAGSIGRDGLHNQILLKDFNDMCFERIKAPY